MAITIVRDATSDNVRITETGKPDFWIMGHFYCVMTANDAGTHIIIRDGDFDVKLLLSDITNIDGNTGPFTVAQALDLIQEHVFKKV